MKDCNELSQKARISPCNNAMFSDWTHFNEAAKMRPCLIGIIFQKYSYYLCEINRYNWYHIFTKYLFAYKQ